MALLLPLVPPELRTSRSLSPLSTLEDAATPRRVAEAAGVGGESPVAGHPAVSTMAAAKKLTLLELEEVKELFALADTTACGRLDYPQAKGALRSLGLRCKARLLPGAARPRIVASPLYVKTCPCGTKPGWRA